MLPDLLPVPDKDSPRWALFLDVDGTLLELAAHPDTVLVPEGLVALLGRLRQSLDGAMALVSGRSLASLDFLLGETGLDAAGCHGAEIRMAGRTSIRAVGDDLVHLVAERLAQRADQFPKTAVEIKTHSVAFHYRHCDLDARQARLLVEEALAGIAPRFVLLDGKRVVEILPVGASKGEAIAHFLTHPPYAGRTPVFVGDDVTDEAGFVEVNRRGGFSIRVGADGNTAAAYRIATVMQALAWLSGPVYRGLAGRGEPGSR